MPGSEVVEGDLISRAAALNAIDCWHIDFNSMDGSKVQTDCWRTIKELPAVDALPVKHGRWKGYNVPHWTKRYEENGDPEYKYHAEYVCSICRRRTIIKENYCPNCGAKMDGDTNG